jgi:uncharacterized membrane protein YfcA
MPVILVCVSIGAAMGLLAGLIGVGGGIIAVPAMIYFLDLSPKAAMVTSLAVIIPVSISGTVKHFMDGKVDLKVAASIAAGGVVFAYLGAWIQHQDWLSEVHLKKGFAVFILCVSLKMLLDKPKAPEKNDEAVSPPAGPAETR